MVRRGVALVFRMRADLQRMKTLNSNRPEERYMDTHIHTCIPPGAARSNANNGSDPYADRDTGQIVGLSSSPS
jgi:hypothetical protein